MRDGAAVALAAAAVAGAWLARPAPVAAVAALALLAVVARRPAALCIATAVLASGLGALAEAGLDVVASGPVESAATLVTDPERRALDGTVVAEARVHLREGERRVQLVGRDATAALLVRSAAGERFEVAGTLRPLPEATRAHLHSRHVVARVDVGRAEWVDAGSIAHRVANRLRALLADGAVSMPDAQQALLLGFVLGDDRGQPERTVEDFRASGLSHLLAVSGQNLAFVLILVGPLLRRLRLAGRVPLAAAVVVGFGLLTRWEPSVLRAAAMAGVGLASRAAGRPISRVRSLSLAVTGLVLVDPLLVRSLGFMLSVGACAGIAVLGGPIDRMLAERVPWPAVRTALATTLAAQAGVAPVQLAAFGPMPVAAVPANLLAGPAAGPLVLYGMTAGLLAGALGGTAAEVLHVPTRAVVGWITGVAHVGAGIPLGGAGAVHVVGVGALLGAAGLVAHRNVRRVAMAAALVVFTMPGLAAVRGSVTAVHGVDIAPGARLWRDGGVTVIVLGADRAPGATTLRRALRARAVRGVSTVVATKPTASVAAAVAELRSGARVRMVLGPAGAPLSGVRVVAVTHRLRAGRLEFVVRPSRGGELAVDVRVASPG